MRIRAFSGGIFDHARPMTPEHASAELDFRARERATLKETPDLEIIPTTGEARRHMQEYAQETNRDDLIKAETNEERPHAFERALAGDLENEILRRLDGSADEERIARLRMLNWEYSHLIKRSNSDPNVARLAALELAKDIRHQTIEKQGESDADIREAAEGVEERAAAIADIASALKNGATGEDMEPFLAQIEYEFQSALKDAADHYHRRARQDAEKKLGQLRTIRDAAYFSRLFPEQERARQRSERIIRRHRAA